MNAVRQAIWLFCALIALACSGWYFASAPAAIRLDDQTLATTADTIVTGLTVRQFDEQGQIANSLVSPRMEHIPENNTHLLIRPYIIVTQTADQPPWEIRARTAKSIQGGGKVTFIDEVYIHQAKGERTAESTFKTDVLDYFPKKKLAMTSSAVVFEQPGSVVQANGMNAWLAEKRVELLGKARAVYDPEHA
ncbi:LPS export ABC transporter periplasmic protein LptC [Legionella dresdenensis]|uniref:LPS export ABC transporter periplasmic protein LptC n=1 Tax=Legionella dresdenensis TaxID=450200 RepID=A0ABV8CBH0_9GAMM